MQTLEELYSSLPKLLPVLAVVAVTAVVLWVLHWVLLRRRARLGLEGRAPRQVAFLALTILGILCILLALPVEDATRAQFLSLLGVALTAVIALSSTTFVANAMTGLMLRAVKSFRPGDFVRAGVQFGRVTERGLFHTEIQTEDRDLTTLPNLYLVSQPLTVVRASGTIVSARVSLGYDVSRTVVEPLLVQAAQASKLQEAFVQVVDLGDFSVTYRVAGFLSETKHLLSTRSNLRRAVLDALHGAGVEIVSPAFMNQRVLQAGARFLPSGADGAAAPPAEVDRPTPEAMIFDKADEAEKIEQLRARRTDLLAEIKELEGQRSKADESRRAALEHALAQKAALAEAIETALAAAEEEQAKDE
ncbi:MAG: mechanosensitive ion channel [bacterium]|nr:mechanosensitive ion channel [bacterium]